MSKKIARTIRPTVIDADDYDERDVIDADEYDERDDRHDDEYDGDDTDADEYDDDQDDDERPGGSWEPQMRKNRAARRAEQKGRRRSAARIPADAPRPRDRKPKQEKRPRRTAPAKSAAQREAEGDEMVVFEFHGFDFEVPADMDDWPTLALQAFSKDLHFDMVEHLLGPMQWAVFNSNFPKRRHFIEFAQMLANEFGFGTMGN